MKMKRGKGHPVEDESILHMDDAPLWSAPFGLKLLDTIRYREGTTALDIGSDTGFPMLELAMRLGGKSSVFGIDPSGAPVNLAAEKKALYGIANACFLLAFAERIPFRRASFDLVVSNNGINNVRDLPMALAEIGRVAKPGAQFVFTFNTDKTFEEFYGLFRETLYDLGIPECNEAINEHIFLKRKPVSYIESRAIKAGFDITSIRDDAFEYRFVDGTAMLTHSFIRSAFFGSWERIVPEKMREVFFGELEKKLNARAGLYGGLRMKVPFVIFDCVRRRE